MSSAFACSTEIPVGYALFLSTQLAPAAADLLLALLEDVELAIERGLAVLDPFLFALDLFATATGFDLPVLAELDQLFLAGNQRALSERFRLTLGLTDDALSSLFGGGLREELPLTFSVAAGAPAKKEKRCGGENDQYAERSTQCCRVHVDLCSTSTSGPRR